jgi:hypothetical protein
VYSATPLSGTAVTPTRSTTAFNVVTGISYTFPLSEAASIGDILFVSVDFPGIYSTSSSAVSLGCTNGKFYHLG